MSNEKAIAILQEHFKDMVSYGDDDLLEALVIAINAINVIEETKKEIEVEKYDG